MFRASKATPIRGIVPRHFRDKRTTKVNGGQPADITICLENLDSEIAPQVVASGVVLAEAEVCGPLLNYLLVDI